MEAIPKVQNLNTRLLLAHDGRGSVQYVVVAINYFTKWVEAEALVSITPAKIKEFVY